MTIVDADPGTCRFHHDALIYDSDESYLAALVPLIRTALDAGDAVLAVVPGHNRRLLQRALGDAVADVQFIDAETWYRHPVATLAAYDAVLRGFSADMGTFVIGEVQFGDSETEWTSWTRYEAAVNRVLCEFDARVVCPYDDRTLPPAVVENARRTHPHLLSASESGQSELFVDVETIFALLPPVVTVPDSFPAVDLVVDGDLGSARRAFAAVAVASGLDDDRVDELTLAVNEVLTNSFLHGGGTARLRAWSSGDELTCVVDDEGTGIDDVLLGYAAPPPASTGGYGVWLARRLFDRSELLRSSSGGLSVLLAARA
jgi:anti-sigma regulatory factor (Ser/Thr protein kinase)